jgi:diaminohydroxyphosphoribosylaminopyrimidine deaminase/5-amino-6-(5-phosphoribosylamino)uracil reductase
VFVKKARTLNEAFITWVTTGRPFVIVKCAATLDGRIATRTGDSRWVTGPDARRFVHRIRHAVDGIMVGVETVKKDDPSLTTRLEEKGADPTRIILDTHLSCRRRPRMLHQAIQSLPHGCLWPGCTEKIAGLTWKSAGAAGHYCAIASGPHRPGG